MAATGVHLPVQNYDQVTLHKVTYSQNLKFQANQRGSYLLDLVTKEPINPGAITFIHKIVKRHEDGTNGLTKKTGRFSNTSAVYTKFAERIMAVDTFVRKEPIRKAEIGSIADPTWPILTETVNDYNIKIDNVILTAALASVNEQYIDTSGVTQLSASAFPSANIILDSSQQGLTYDRICDLEGEFSTNKVPIQYEPIFLIVHPKVFADAKKQDKFISKDYRDDYSIRDKVILPKINSVVILSSPEVTTYTVDGVSYYKNVAFTMQGMVLGQEEEYSVDYVQDSDIDGDYYLITRRGLCAIRTDDYRVMQFNTAVLDSMTV